MNKIYFAMALASLTVVACSNNDDMMSDGASGELVTIASVGVGEASTRAITGENKLVETDLALFIYDADDKYKANSERWLHTTAEGWQFQPTLDDSKQVYWKGGSVVWRVCSPSSFSPNTTSVQSVAAVIADEDDYNGSDLLWGNGTATAKELDITLQHAMTRLDVNLIKGTSLEGKAIESINIPDAYTSFDNNAATANSLAEVSSVLSGSKSTLKTKYQQTPPAGFDESYTTIFVPQTLAPFTLQVVTTDYSVYTLELPTFTFEAGKRYTLDLQVGQDLVQLGGIQAADWNVVDAGTLETE